MTPTAVSSARSVAMTAAMSAPAPHPQEIPAEEGRRMISALDPRETHVWIPSSIAGLHLFLRHLPPATDVAPRGVVLYVHGGTFPSALSIAHRFDGRSWRDELCAAGFHTWGLDLHGFGALSDPYPDPAGADPLGRTADASAQLVQAVRF